MIGTAKTDRKRSGIALTAATLLVGWAFTSVAAKDATYDIVEFQCSETKALGEIVELNVKVKRKGKPDAGTLLSVSGESGPTTVFGESVSIFDTKKGESESKFFYSTDLLGTIQWSAQVTGDTAQCTTTVVAGDGDGGDDDDGDDDDGDGDPTPISDNIVGLHDSSSPQYAEHCLECHVDILSEHSLDPAIPGAHVAMRPHVPGEDDEKTCVWCHRSVNLEYGPQSADNSFGNLRKRVDVRLCTLCHGPSRSAGQFYEAGLSQTNPDGPLLYELTCSACHGALGESEVAGESAAEIAGEIADDEGGMGPLNFLTAPEIQAIADALAQ